VRGVQEPASAFIRHVMFYARCYRFTRACCRRLIFSRPFYARQLRVEYQSVHPYTIANHGVFFSSRLTTQAAVCKGVVGSRAKWCR